MVQQEATAQRAELQRRGDAATARRGRGQGHRAGALWGRYRPRRDARTARSLRSPHAHARILAIDTRRAEALAGVYAVITAQDLAQVTRGGQRSAGRISCATAYLASDKVLYVGHPVAAVAARTAQLAEEARGTDRRGLRGAAAGAGRARGMPSRMRPSCTSTCTRARWPDAAAAPATWPATSQDVKGNPTARVRRGRRDRRARVQHSTMVHQGYIEPHTRGARPSWTAVPMAA